MHGLNVPLIAEASENLWHCEKTSNLISHIESAKESARQQAKGIAKPYSRIPPKYMS
jgi:hypothetical protein